MEREPGPVEQVPGPAEQVPAEQVPGPAGLVQGPAELVSEPAELVTAPAELVSEPVELVSEPVASEPVVPDPVEWAAANSACSDPSSLHCQRARETEGSPRQNHGACRSC